MSDAVAKFGPPVRVSPFIRFCRWSLLLAGVFYGMSRHNSLKKKEDANRAYIAKMTPIWTEQRNKKKAELDKIEMDALSKEMGSKIA